jgi:2-keto-3-deoxy-L-rhamnonate aldolase RhmA
LGVIVLHIRSVQDAKDVVMAANFQLQGRRSSTNGPPHFKFKLYPVKVSNAVVNVSTLVILTIETPEALELVDEIAAHDRVDSLLIDTNDLTAEMGIPGNYEDPRPTEVYQRTFNACQKVGKWVC